MMKKRSLLAIVLTLAMVLTLFAGCSPRTASTDPPASGGILCLRVNPEIAVHYDAQGKVTRVEARNDDGIAITADYTGYEGSDVHQVVVELVTAIGEAGYFLEELEGQRRQITLEIEPGSIVPSDTFLADVADAVQICVNSNSWPAPVDIRKDVRTCTNPHCRDNDCDDLICDAGVCTNPYCDEKDCDDADCDDNIPGRDDDRYDDRDVRTCTNPHCKDNDCDDLICDAGVCTNPYCDERDCDDADCNDNIPGRDDDRYDDRDVRTCTNPHCRDNDCDDLICDAGVCTNPYCDERDCDDADCDDNIPGRDD